MSAPVEESYYHRYRGAARRFEGIGGVVVLAGLVVWAAAGPGAQGIGLSILLIGLCIFSIGAASLRPHNAVKSFARQLIQQPSGPFAQGLLDALEAPSKLALVSGSVALVNRAVASYCQMEDADPELARRLEQAAADKITIRTV